MLSFVDNGARIQAYWQATGSNSILGEIMNNASEEVMDSLYKLLDGQSIGTYIDTAVVYPEIENNSSSIYSFLLMAGYLTIEQADSLYDGNSYGAVYIPNREVKTAYEKEIISQLDSVISSGSAIILQRALISNNVILLENELNNFLRKSVSFYDTSTEGFYHGLMLGLMALLGNYYMIESNRESGDGRYDIVLKPFNKKMTAYVLGLKSLRGNIQREKLQDKLVVEAIRAIGQIENLEYFSQLQKDNYKFIVGYGIAFYKKKCHIESKKFDIK